MIFKLWDRTEFVVSNDQAELMKQAIRDGAPAIEVPGRFMKPGAIATTMPGGYTEADTPRINVSRRIEAPDHRGRPSPAKERLREVLEQHHIGAEANSDNVAEPEANKSSDSHIASTIPSVTRNSAHLVMTDLRARRNWPSLSVSATS